MPEHLPLRVLPFRDDAFDWNRFESFCLAIVRALPEVRRAARYGDTGEAQRGIDIEADLVDGRKRTIQCRHRKRITRAQVAKTIADTDYPADEHEIWVTCNVGKNASDLIESLAGWTIESAEGICQKLRLEIDRERARLIVADAFGARTSRKFLGPDAPFAFLSSEDFFAPFDKPDRLLRHDLPLVGRGKELAGLIDAAASPEARVVVLVGRGGIGKTRLLRAAGEALSQHGKRTLFTLDGGALTPEVVEDLPLEDTVVFVDDAHRGDIPLTLLLAATRRSDPLTVVLGTRPAGLDRINAACTDAGLEPQHVIELPRLGSLSYDEAHTLAAEVLGERSARTEHLADATEKLPLLTVVGGRLLARGAFSPDPSQGAEQLRRSVMTRFVAEQRGRITPRVPEPRAQELLTLLAALSPLDTSNAALMQLVAEELGVAQSRLRRWLGEVQDAGLLLTRGNRRRLTPDVLADEILFEACLDPQGRPTGRAQELWQRYSPHAASELLVNLGELDWRSTASGTSLLDDVWKEITEVFARSDAWERERLIDRLAPAAVLAPAPVLKLVDEAMERPAATSDWSAFSMQIDDGSVRLKLPVLLQAVGRHPDHAHAAMRRLWILGRDDTRPTHSYPEHPLRVIRELGGYDFGTPHHEALLDLVAQEVAAADVDAHAVSPLGLLDALLARDGMHSRTVGLEWRIQPFFVHTDTTEPWRRQVRELLVTQALHGSPRQRSAAAGLFDDALRLPPGPAPDAVREAWRVDQLNLLAAIAQIAGESTDPAVRSQLARAVRFHAEHERWDDVRERAAELLEQLSGDDELLLTSLAAPWEILDEEKKQERDQRAAALLVQRCSDGRHLAQYLDELLAEVVDRQMSDQPSVDSPVFYVLRDSPTYARGLWEWSVANPDVHIASIASMALATMRAAGDDIQGRLTRAGRSDQADVRRLAAGYLCGGQWFDDPSPMELELLETLALDDDTRVRDLVSTTLLRMRSKAPALAVRLALRARVDPNDGRSADMLFATVVEFGVDELDEAQVGQLLAQLENVREPGHFAHQALAALGARDPACVIELWAARLRREQEGDRSGYQAVPFHDFRVEMLGDVRGATRVALHERLLGHLRALTGSRRRELGRLFWRLVVPGLSDDKADDRCLADHRQAIDAAWKAVRRHAECAPTDRDELTHVLAELPWQVLLASPKDVAALIELDATTTDEGRRNLRDVLYSAASTGVHGRTVGEDSPRWTATMRQAGVAAKTLPNGSAGARFYLDVEEMARRELDNDRREDDEERRGWH